MIKNNVNYQDLGPAHFLRRIHPARQANRLVTQLQQLDRLPTTGALLFVQPLRLVGGTGSPARVLALVERS